MIGSLFSGIGERLQALGNAVVPQCAYEVGRFIQEQMIT